MFLQGYYDGDFHDDKKEGNGIMLYSNNDRYIGEWRNNKRGFGILTLSNGEICESQWINDKYIK